MNLPSKAHTYRMLIGSEWVDSAGGERITRQSPAHDVPVSEYPLAGAADVDGAVRSALRSWRRSKGASRPPAARCWAI